jgi:hypothetical protein
MPQTEHPELHDIKNEIVRKRKNEIFEYVSAGKEIEIMNYFHRKNFNSDLKPEYKMYFMEVYGIIIDEGKEEIYSKYFATAKTIEKMFEDKETQDFIERQIKRKKESSKIVQSYFYEHRN